uniref:Protein phosphatase 1 regulatory subunit 36 n=1 Tax=Leptobrachium leishanense TaxID=445787 RepID=A0A8C5QQ61_9ANUR
MEPVAKPVPGHWYWREDTKTLEFLSNNSTADGRERVRRARAIHFQESESKAPDRVTTQHCFNMAAGTKFSKARYTDPVPRSPKYMNKNDHEYITLEDVKRVALHLLKDEEKLYIDVFSEAVRSQHLDEFLMSLLSYLSCYLEKTALERKPKSLLPNLNVEQKEVANISMRTQVALKHFAHAYCVLVLGQRMSDQHHMSCGKSKSSASKRDRMFYECLYSFCIHVAWVVFRRKELSLIQTEVGRILRSNTFNPALRVKNVPEDTGKNLSVLEKKLKKTATYVPNRKENAKRPAIKSILTQRSPLLTSLMPTMKEQSQYLYHQHGLHPKVSHEVSDMSLNLIVSQVGILGEPRKHFKPYTLTPLGTEEDEEPEIGCHKSTMSFYSQGRSSRHSNIRPGTGRQSTVISRATTEAAYSDMDDDPPVL